VRREDGLGVPQDLDLVALRELAERRRALHVARQVVLEEVLRRGGALDLAAFGGPTTGFCLNKTAKNYFKTEKHCLNMFFLFCVNKSQLST